LELIFLVRTYVGTAYSNGSSKEGKTDDVRTRKLSVSLTSHWSRASLSHGSFDVTVTNFVLLETRRFPDQCGASARCTKDALPQPCCKECINHFGRIERLRRETWTRTRTRPTRGGAKDSRKFYPTLPTHVRELVLCFSLV